MLINVVMSLLLLVVVGCGEVPVSGLDLEGTDAAVDEGDGSSVGVSAAALCEEREIVCPAGEQGLVGPQGPAGEQGQPGAQGEAGPQGPAGADGADGAMGPAGAMGAAGPRGFTGLTGATGQPGATGATGAQGPQGAKGDKGDTGAAGAFAEGSLYTNSVTVPAATQQATKTTGIAHCDAGDIALAGTCSGSGAYDNWHLRSAGWLDGGVDPDGWMCLYQHQANSAFSVFVAVRCLDVTP